MQLSPLFKIRTEATPELIQLLDQVTLGTNGAKYRHLNTVDRIHNADQPLHLSVERNEKLLGNATFCQREREWYVRYFAFNPSFQSTGAKKSRSNDNFLKRELDLCSRGTTQMHSWLKITMCLHYNSNVYSVGAIISAIFHHTPQ